MSTSRARIEPLALEHEARFLEGVRRSRELHRDYVSPPATPEAFAAYVKRFDADTHYGFAVLHSGGDEMVGSIAVNEVVRGKFWSGYLGYQAFAPMQGRGLMRQGLALVLDHAFGTLGLHRVEANIQPGNRSSIGLVARLGFRQEGFSPRYLEIDGEWRDHERWALLADEWPAPARDR